MTKRTILRSFLILLLFCAFISCKSKATRFYEQGQEAYYNGQTNQAISLYRKGLDLKPKDARLLYAIGWAFFSMQQYDQAIVYFSRTIKVKPKHFGGYKGLGSVYATLGQNGKAKEYLFKAIERDPKNGAIYSNLGDLYKQMGQYDDARISYNKAISLIPKHGDPMVGLIDLHHQYQEWQQAITHIDAALKKPFKQRVLKNQTQYLWVKTFILMSDQHIIKNEKIELAKKDYKKATALIETIGEQDLGLRLYSLLQSELPRIGIKA